MVPKCRGKIKSFFFGYVKIVAIVNLQLCITKAAIAPQPHQERKYIVGIIVLSPLQIHTVFYLAIKVFPQHRNKSCIVHASLIWWTSSKEKYVYAKKRKLWIHYMIATTQFGMCNTEA